MTFRTYFSLKAGSIHILGAVGFCTLSFFVNIGVPPRPIEDKYAKLGEFEARRLPALQMLRP